MPAPSQDDARVQYNRGYYGSSERYLVKALREVARRIEGLIIDLEGPQLRWRASDESWCATELIGFLRDSEREDLLAVRAMLRRDGAPIEERRAYHGPDEHNYRDAMIEELWWDFADLRENMVWTLRAGSDDSGWDNAGKHVFRGRIPLVDYVRQINERDLDTMWKLYDLREQMEAAGIARQSVPRGAA
jgi:hypothetical protein